MPNIIILLTLFLFSCGHQDRVPASLTSSTHNLNFQSVIMLSENILVANFGENIVGLKAGPDYEIGRGNVVNSCIPEWHSLYSKSLISDVQLTLRPGMTQIESRDFHGNLVVNYALPHSYGMYATYGFPGESKFLEREHLSKGCDINNIKEEIERMLLDNDLDLRFNKDKLVIPKAKSQFQRRKIKISFDDNSIIEGVKVYLAGENFEAESNPRIVPLVLLRSPESGEEFNIPVIVGRKVILQVFHHHKAPLQWNREKNNFYILVDPEKLETLTISSSTTKKSKIGRIIDSRAIITINNN